MGINRKQSKVKENKEEGSLERPHENRTHDSRSRGYY